MATTSLARSSLKTLTKYDSFLVGNAAYDPTAFESIATAVGNGTSNVITFSSIPSTYKHLQIRVLGRSGAGGTSSALQLRYNGDTGSNYVNHSLRGDGINNTGNGAIGQTANSIVLMTASGSSANTMAVVIYDILNYASTSNNKVIRAISGNDQNGSGDIWLSSGLWLSTSAVTSITLNTGTNWTTNSTIALYGIN